MLARLAHVIARHRWPISFVWLALTIFGAFSTGQLADRWYQSFALPGNDAYEASQRTATKFGNGELPPTVVVFKTGGDATKSEAIRAAMERTAKANPGARTSSYYSTGSDAYVSPDRHVAFQQIYPPRKSAIELETIVKATEKAAEAGLPAGTRRPGTQRSPRCHGSTSRMRGDQVAQ